MKKAAIYSPYLDSFGGGEKYILTIAQILSKDYLVDLLFDNHLFSMGSAKLKKDLAERFNLDLSKVNIVHAPLGKGSNALDRTLFLKKYDLLIYLTDGSIFNSTAKKNILHIQFPISGQPAESLWGKIKLKSWDIIIYNSKFTKEHSQKNWPIKSEVIYPPVDVDKIKPLTKKKYILSVGRFFGYLKSKKQTVLIEAFKKIKKNNKSSGWSLHLVGSALAGDLDYLKALKKMAKGMDVNFYPNLRYDDLIKLYGESSLYWHAAGYKEDDPAKMEHFGIATVEAMAAGCVPVVIGLGGQLEILNDGKSGFLWNNLAELEDRSLRLMTDQKLWKALSSAAITKSKNFSKNSFENNIKRLITRI